MFAILGQNIDALAYASLYDYTKYFPIVLYTRQRNLRIRKENKRAYTGIEKLKCSVVIIFTKISTCQAKVADNIA